MRVIILGLLAALTVAGVASADDKADIQARNDALSAAAQRADGPAMAAFYAPDAVMLPPDNSVVSGPAAIGAYLARLEKGGANLKLTTSEVVRISPDFIREVGVASFDTLGAKPVNVKGSYVVVWKRVGGTWKLWTDIFH